MPPRDSVGRAFLRSPPPLPQREEVPSGRLCDCTGAPHRMEADCLDPRTLLYRDGTPYEVRLMMSGGMACRNQGMRVDIRMERPSPAENARRYTSEEETW